MKSHLLNPFWMITILSLGLTIRLYLDLRDIQSELNIEKNRLNVTPNAQEDIILFNRVPKVGSQTLWKIIDSLAYINGFNSTIDSHKLKAARGSENVFMREVEQKDYVNMWMNEIAKPFVYNKHFLFINFEDFGQVNPIYINLVRHPVERIISWYYYIRNPHYQFNVNDKSDAYESIKSGMAIGNLKRSLEDCVLAQRRECTYEKGQFVLGGEVGGSHQSQIAFFCGMHPECHQLESIKAYDRAVENLNKYFAVVGVSEEYSKSLQVLEAYVPRFFKNVDEVYKNGSINKNHFKPKVSQDVWNVLARNLTLEIKFYEYCKERLHKQYMAISITQ